MLATLSRWRSRVQIPPGTLNRSARYANRHSGEAQTFVTLWVRLPPVSLDRVVFSAAACKAVVVKQAEWTTRGSIPSRPTFGPFVYRQDAGPSSREGGFNSRAGHSEQAETMAKWCNW